MHLTRWAAVPLTTALLGLTTFVGAAPAEAAGSCELPMPLAGVGVGVLPDDTLFEDFWRYEAAGTTTIRTTDVGAAFVVFNASCSAVVCSSTSLCVTNATGPLIIAVYRAHSAPSAYVLTATSSVSPTSSCNRVDTSGVCVHLATGTLVEERTVYDVTTTPVATHTVGGWLDAYRFPLPTGGSAVVPCVVLSANTRDANPCETAGGTFVSRAATLVTRSVTQPAPIQGAALATVRVCNATLTATVGGFGLENVPVYSTC